MKRRRVALSLSALFALIVSPVASKAQIPMTGRFVAEAQCPALQSIKKRTNPGGLATEPGRSYVLLARNSDPASHYYIEIPDAEPKRRWVAVGCGRIEAQSQVAEREEKTRNASSTHVATRSRGDKALAKALAGSRRTAGSAGEGPSGRYVLAASWHAAFCETSPHMRDCVTGGVDKGFSLHGLWPQSPQNEYCGVSRRMVETDREGGWHRLPPPDLLPATRRNLARVMPGTTAFLDRHEWIRHGTCYGADAERYFSDAVRLIDDLNRSAVGRLFQASRNEPLDTARIRTTFDKAFGAGAGRRVLVDCADQGGRRLIIELRLNIAGRVADTRLPDLLEAGRPSPRGCPGGVVDASGT